jgi:hypothetical protein
MERSTPLSFMRIKFLLIHIARWNEEVKGLFKGFLGIVKQGVKAIPAGGPQRTRRILEPSKVEWHDLIGGILKGDLVHQIGRRIVLDGIALDATAQTANALQIRLHIRAPLSLGP